MDPKRSASILFTRHRDVTANLFDDTVDKGQPQSPPARLDGKKRFKEISHHGRRNPFPRIGHAEQDIFPGSGLRIRAGLLIRMDISCGNP